MAGVVHAEINALLDRTEPLVEMTYIDSGSKAFVKGPYSLRSAVNGFSRSGGGIPKFSTKTNDGFLENCSHASTLIGELAILLSNIDIANAGNSMPTDYYRRRLARVVHMLQEMGEMHEEVAKRMRSGRSRKTVLTGG